jgi:aryl-alcohol dehydrogenase-like predicted oxidoreductase
MKYRTLGKTGFEVSEVALGTWQVGGRWGEDFDDSNADETLNRAIDAGVNFLDTADGYGGGLSERAVGRVVRKRSERIYVASKCGRRLKPHTAEGYTKKNIRGFVEASLKNTGLDVIDLIQLHCPPTQVYYNPEVFEALDNLQREGKIRNYGVSVEKVEEALKAIEYSNLATVQIIFNMFRQRPADLFFSEAEKKNIGIIVRVPLASGLLTGKLTQKSCFSDQDHRTYNREGQKFDKGETFAGVDYKVGLEAVEKLKSLFSDQSSLALSALKWILAFEEVSCIIPGASRPEQAEANVKASDLPPVDDRNMAEVRKIYTEKIQPLVHHRW